MIRKEIHTRTIFAHDMAAHWFERMKNVQKTAGNLCSSVATRKFLQARRIYVHYTREYQKQTGLPLIGDIIKKTSPRVKYNSRKILANSGPLGTCGDFHYSD